VSPSSVSLANARICSLVRYAWLDQRPSSSIRG
jgi:hypothetical protein